MTGTGVMEGEPDLQDSGHRPSRQGYQHRAMARTYDCLELPIGPPDRFINSGSSS
jgi:hypothetical protein